MQDWRTLYQQKLTTDISGGTAPDVSVLASIWLSEFATQGLIEVDKREIHIPDVARLANYPGR